jgi:hypothetical protein
VIRIVLTPEFFYWKDLDYISLQVLGVELDLTHIPGYTSISFDSRERFAKDMSV